MSDLKTFINTTRYSRELKRALAVKNTLAGRPWHDVAKELEVCESFIGKWRKIYAQQGIEGLKLGYKGSSGYLSPDAKVDVIRWLWDRSHLRLGKSNQLYSKAAWRDISIPTKLLCIAT